VLYYTIRRIAIFYDSGIVTHDRRIGSRSLLEVHITLVLGPFFCGRVLRLVFQIKRRFPNCTSESVKARPLRSRENIEKRSSNLQAINLKPFFGLWRWLWIVLCTYVHRTKAAGDLWLSEVKNLLCAENNNCYNMSN
jgi:hypothetical protein